MSSTEEVDRLAELFSSCVTDALAHSSVESCKSAARPRQQIPSDLLSLIQRKRKLRRHFPRTRCPTTKSQLNALAEKISRGLAVHSEYSWLEYLASAGEDWNGIHRLCRRLANKPAPIRPLLAADGTIRYRTEDRAEIFADSLETQFSPNPSDDHRREAAIEQRLADYFAAPMTPDEDAIVFSPGQVARMIRHVPLKKAPGPDRIPNEALRHLPPRAVATLTRLFNGVLRTGHFPRP